MFQSAENSETESSGSDDEENVHQPEAKKHFTAHGFDDAASKQEQWMLKNLREKLEDVLEGLDSKHSRQEDGPSAKVVVDMSVIEDFKLKAILEPTRDEYFHETPTALHVMAKYHSSDEFKPFSKRARRAVIRYLLEHPPPEPAAGGRPSTIDKGHLAAAPVLMTAMIYNKADDEFLEHVRDFSEVKFADLLEETDSGGRNSLHAVFGSYSGKFHTDERALTLRRARLLVPLSKPTTITAKSAADKGNTPLHLALHYRQVRKRGADYVDMVRCMITKMEGDKQGMSDAFNTTEDEESPILFHKRTKRAYNKDVKRARQEASMPEASSRPETSSEPQAAVVSSKLAAQKATSSAGTPQNLANTASAPWTEKDQKDRKTKTQKNPRPETGDHIHVSRVINLSIGDMGFLAKQQMDPSRGCPGHELSSRGPSAHESSSRGPAPALEVEIPRSAAAAGPAAPPVSKPGPGSTAPSTSQEAPSTKQPAATAEANSKTQVERPKTSDLIDFLEQHYIRTLSELAARDLIYGKIKASDINLSFDGGTGLANVDEIRTLIRFMNRGGGFSPILASVRLPKVNRRLSEELSERPPQKTYKYRANQKSARSRPDGGRDDDENPDPGLDELVAVFRDLAGAGVKTIMRLEVDDLRPLSHSDAAIETALRPSGEDVPGDSKSLIPRYFSIEEWDWKKPDLCIDVIEFTAPEVQKVNLYWSGNRSTLRGWSCAAGLPKLYWGKRKLSNVIVYAAPGVERRVRMQADLSQFKSEIEAATKNGVKVELVARMSGLQVSGSSKETTDGGAQQLPDDSQHIWIKHVESFRTQLLPVHQLLDELGIPAPPRVKVALIDDGTDLGKLLERKGIELTVTGLNCSSSTGSASSPTPWYRSSQGHGTTMANMLLRVNPWISLSVMKLSDGTSSEGAGTICAESAAQAIRAAIARHVDIISMSWTVKQKLAQTGVEGDTPENKDGMALLRKAVEAAAKKGIIMFCSASDEIEANARASLPYGAAPSHILRIGAADAMGQSDPTVESKQEISYYFPGNKVALASDPRALNPSSSGDDALKDGSSIATALAAGLASLIKYCAVLSWKFYEHQNAAQQEEAGRRKDATPSVIDRKVLDKAIFEIKRGEPEKFRSYVEDLSKKVFMERAFNNIEAENWPSDSKFLPVWETFGDTAKTMEEGDHAVKMMALVKLTTELCNKFNKVAR